MDLKRIAGSAVLFAAIPLFANGCGGADALCCTDFQVGADLSGADFGVDADIAGEFSVLAQAASDFSATATGMVSDVTSACRGIASDLGASQADLDKNDQITDVNAQVDSMCKLAIAQLTASGFAKGSLQIEPPSFSCEASISAKADCSAKCSGGASCDIKATPPKCEGGKLVVDCKGGCTATAEAPSFKCSGSCSAAVSGSCTAQGGVDCEGKCDGECSAGANAGDTGIQADGTCKGTCKGSCSVVAPSAKCEGSFEGECSGSCTASPGKASVQCDAKCDVEAEPLKCEGGTLTGGCKVEAKCDANCDASVNAKASCEVKPFSIKATASAGANIAAVIDTLKVNLPKLILAVKARGTAMAKISANFTGKGTVDLVADPGKLGIKGTACLAQIAPAIVDGAATAVASVNAGLTITGAVGIN